MAPKPPRFTSDVYDSFPDDDKVKIVQLQAAGLSYSGVGDRHVVIQWYNATNVTQLIQLSGNPGNYAFYSPWGRSEPAFKLNDTFYTLGEFTRAQRDIILVLADAVRFEKSSTVNSCRTWTRDLLEAMVQDGLLSQEIFDKIDQEVPLLKRRPEV
ncbi:hypothetical protein EUX98_g1812 [Antrodiella citrinella]|uniref:Uncharacterized protein n=1 Tax=Antrodiella citrinella TaxID=2447956 RepID=A0A4S4N0J4_9APHY|nr:hypothetical protein EUX98_g1812 [Antrodiella citrinella]